MGQTITLINFVENLSGRTEKYTGIWPDKHMRSFVGNLPAKWYRKTEIYWNLDKYMHYFVGNFLGNVYRNTEKYTGIWPDKHMRSFVGNLPAKWYRKTEIYWNLTIQSTSR